MAARCRIVLAAIDREPNQQIASSLRIPPITVSKWRRALASGGMKGLQDAPRSGATD
ncbi:MAG: helix-turn-helix domain-containing protein [Acidobacteria bacterium]|nr:helix-turn-helix domain-containing protein [Acidobacteriota bacterium]